MADTTDPKDPTHQVIDMREVGATGLRRFSGFIFEEFLQELTGWKGIAVYKEMSKNDATVKACLTTIKMMCRRVPWRTQAASEEQFDIDAAEFLETCMDDMSMTWTDVIIEALSMLEYGFCVQEIVYKRRCGDSLDPAYRSKHSDGRIGWRKLSIRSQDTIYRWQFDDKGGIQGVEQLAPPHYCHVTIPVEKMLLYRTTTDKNNPEGESILRGAYRSWYMKKNIENIEGIGLERDLAGLPMAYVPSEIMSTNATAAQKAILAEVKNIVTNVRRDEQEGIVFPMIYDAGGKPLYEFKLLSTGGQRQFDTDKVITRYKVEIAQSMLADFIMLGHDKTGSYALSSSKTDIFAVAIGAFLDIIADTINRYAVPRLFALNDIQCSAYPKIMHGDLDAVDLKELGDYLVKLTQSGMPLFPTLDGELEKYLMKVANLPEIKDPLKQQSLRIDPKVPEAPNKVTEIHTDADKAKLNEEPKDKTDTAPVNDKPPVTTVTNDGPVDHIKAMGDANRAARNM